LKAPIFLAIFSHFFPWEIQPKIWANAYELHTHIKCLGFGQRMPLSENSKKKNSPFSISDQQK
jgi:hypothetical protein